MAYQRRQLAVLGSRFRYSVRTSSTQFALAVLSSPTLAGEAHDAHSEFLSQLKG